VLRLEPAIRRSVRPSAGDDQAGHERGTARGVPGVRDVVETPAKIRSESDKGGIKTSDAQGFGPGAFYAVGSYGVTQLNAFKGSTQVMVQLMLMTSPPDKVREALAKLMTVVLPNVK
jgi:hypothetical protein